MDGSLELLCFGVGARRFAVDIQVVREILRPRPVTPVPGAPAGVQGVFNLRGELVPVVDTHRLLGEPAPSETPADAKFVVVRAGGSTFAVPVDRLFDVVSVPLDQVVPAPGGEDPERAVVVGMFRLGGDEEGNPVVLLLRAGRLFAGGRGPGGPEA